MSIAMGARRHVYLHIKKTTSVPILVLLSQNAQSYTLAVGLYGLLDLRKNRIPPLILVASAILHRPCII